MFIKITIALIFILTSLPSDMVQKGGNVFKIMCDQEKVLALSNTDKDSLKKTIKTQNLCGHLSETNLEALMLFLTSPKTGTAQHITVLKEAKCPVCGMFVAKYPKWSALLTLQNGKKLYFDGVKDMMKFYFDQTRYHGDGTPVAEITVTDYYTLHAIDGKKAFYVIGSSVYGPMGEELIPFESKEAAQTFLDEHHGKNIVTFDTIEESFLY